MLYNNLDDMNSYVETHKIYVKRPSIIISMVIDTEKHKVVEHFQV